MSRIGRAPITVPAGVEVTVNGNHVTVKEQGETSVARYVYLKRFSTFRTERTAVFDEQAAAFVTRGGMRNPGGALNVIANRKTGIAARV